MKWIIIFMLLVLGCSSTSFMKLQDMERPIICIAKSNIRDFRAIVVKDANGKILKIKEVSFVHSYSKGDTIK